MVSSQLIAAHSYVEEAMKLYALIGSQIGSPEATALSERLAAWHDAMVGHERRLRGAPAAIDCDEDCPHSEARVLWTEVLEAFPERARDLSFLRSRATDSGRGSYESP